MIRMPIYKLKCLEEAVRNLAERKEADLVGADQKIKRYKLANEYIKPNEFTFLYLIRRNREYSEIEVLREAEKWDF